MKAEEKEIYEKNIRDIMEDIWEGPVPMEEAQRYAPRFLRAARRIITLEIADDLEKVWQEFMLNEAAEISENHMLHFADVIKDIIKELRFRHLVTVKPMRTLQGDVYRNGDTLPTRKGGTQMYYENIFYDIPYSVPNNIDDMLDYCRQQHAERQKYLDFLNRDKLEP